MRRSGDRVRATAALVAIVLAAVLIISGWNPHAHTPALPEGGRPSSVPNHEFAGSPGLRGVESPSAVGESAVRLTPPRTDGVEFGPLAVRVFSSRSGLPIGGAAVHFTSQADQLTSTASAHFTSKTGSVDVEAPAVPYYLAVAADGYIPWQARIDEAVEERHLDVEMEEGRTLSGTVLQLGGAPVVGARVFAHPPLNRIGTSNDGEPPLVYAGARGAMAHAVTDGLGGFVLRGLPVDQELSIWAQKAGWIPRLSIQQVVGPRATQAQIEMLPVMTLEVLIRDKSTGGALDPLRPICGLTLPPNCYAGGGRMGWPFDDSSVGESDALSFRRKVYLYPNYAGPIPSPEHCRAFVKVSCVGYGPESLEVVLVPGKTVTRDVLLSAQDSVRQSLRFSATAPDGSPFDGRLRVRVLDMNSMTHVRALTAELDLIFLEGRVEAPVSLPVGEYVLVPAGDPDDPSLVRKWWSPCGGSVTLVLDGSRGEREVMLSLRGSPITVKVVDEAFREVRGYDLSLMAGETLLESGAMWDMLRLTGDPLASPRDPPVLWLPPGPATLVAVLPGLGTGQASLEVGGAGEPQRLIIQLNE